MDTYHRISEVYNLLYFFLFFMQVMVKLTALCWWETGLITSGCSMTAAGCRAPSRTGRNSASLRKPTGVIPHGHGTHTVLKGRVHPNMETFAVIFFLLNTKKEVLNHHTALFHTATVHSGCQAPKKHHKSGLYEK